MSSRDRASFDPPSTSGAVSASSGSEGEPLFPLRSMVTRSTNPKSRSPSPRSRRAVGGSSRLEAGPARAGRELRGLAGWAAGPGGAGMLRGLAAPGSGCAASPGRSGLEGGSATRGFGDLSRPSPVGGPRERKTAPGYCQPQSPPSGALGQPSLAAGGCPLCTPNAEADS